MSVMEVGLFIDQRFASYLAVGSVTLIKYANRFMGIPLGVFASAFSTILLPHFTRVKMDNPERLNMYLMESIKLVLWVTIPATFILCFLSEQVFLTLFASMSSKFPADRVPEAGWILVGYMFGLCCFSLNKILLSLYYAFHDTRIPMFISVISTLANIAGNYYFVDMWGAYGLAVATSLSGLIQTILSLYFLRTHHSFSIDYREIGRFVALYMLQVAAVLIPLWALYERIFCEIQQTSYNAVFTQQIWFWAWAGPLLLIAYGLLYLMRNRAGTNMYFLN
jgi:putative peptidoglycan lipid II flippase